MRQWQNGGVLKPDVKAELVKFCGGKEMRGAQMAAAGGVVSTVAFVPEYGNIVDVDHDNGLTSRYAHLSKSLVKVGDVVMKGQKIALVGATGRVTGPHLHFEVRENGIPLNPNKFLSLGKNDVLLNVSNDPH